MATTRIAIWSGPRNVSTALMYSFANRPDTVVVDEPLFGAFLHQTGVARPSREEALAAMSTNAQTVLQGLLAPQAAPVHMAKHMANHLEVLPLDAVRAFSNVILTRHPAAVIASYTKNIAAPTMLDLAYAHQVKLLQYLQANQLPVVVIDSDQLRKHPREALTALCKAVEIPFQPQMLRWPAGPRPEDGVWAKYWYANVHKSTGFAPYKPQRPEVSEALQPLLRQCLPLYKTLQQYLLPISVADE